MFMGGNILGSLGNFDRANPDNLKIMPLEADKKQHIDIPFKDKVITSKELTRLVLFLLCYEKVQKFLDPSHQNRLLTKNLFNTLSHLKNLFETLSKEDLSQNYHFAEDLSKHWHLVLHYIEEERRHKRSPPYLDNLTRFVQTLNSYPERTDHSLGYYLTQFTGEKWLPFPFMDLLHNLHKEALLNQTKNILSTWTQDLSTLLHETNPLNS